MKGNLNLETLKANVKKSFPTMKFRFQALHNGWQAKAYGGFYVALYQKGLWTIVEDEDLVYTGHSFEEVLKNYTTGNDEG